MKKILSILVIAGISVVGCAHKGTVKETVQYQPEKRVSASDQNRTDKIQTDKKIPIEAVTSKDSDVMTPGESSRLLKELQAKTGDIHFDFNEYIIKDNDKPILRKVADILIENEKFKVIIEGSCDERGTNEYNLALGERRAYAARNYLLSMGIQSERMDTVSYGEEKPLCTESNEACWAKNRRDHFVLNEGRF